MKTLALFSLIFLGIQAYSATIDTTIFSSTQEQNLITSIVDSNTVDALDLLLSFDYNKKETEQIKKQIKDIVAALDVKKIATKNKKKQIKEIYKKVHATLLKKYSEKAFFNDAFRTGEYNCVTASAVICLILDHYGVKYEVKETPTHVYIIADPDYNKVKIETTLPQHGVAVYDEKYKKDYVNYLLSNKIISEKEYNQHSTDYLFNEHYDQNKSIDIYQLAAIQYYNKGISLYNESKFRESQKNFEKAYLIYPSETIKFFLFASLGNSLALENRDKEYKGKTLAKYLNISINNADALNAGEQFFSSVSNDLVIEHPHIEKYQAYFNEFSSLLSDSIDMDAYNQTYYRVLGYYYYLNGDYPSALSQLNFAYIANPDQLDTRELIENVCSKHIFTDNRYEASIDSLEHYFEIFPFLLNRDQFQRYYVYCYVRTIDNYLKYDKIAKGKEFLNRLEEALESNDKMNYNENYIEEIYLALSSYHAERREFNLAMSYIDKGSKFCPYSLALKQQAQNVRNYKKFNAERYSKTYTQNTIESITPSRSDIFRANFDKYFQENWKAVAVIENGETKKVNRHIKFEIEVKENKNVEFIFEGLNYKGKWSIRPKSKLLYLIPERAKEKYLMFKVDSISENEIRLRYFHKDHFENRVYVLKIKQD